MSTKWGKAPSYRHHKPSGRAFVVFKRRPIYLGKHATPASVEAYNRFTQLWQQLATGERNLLAKLGARDLHSAEAFDRFVAQHCPRIDRAAPQLLSGATPADLTVFELVDRYWQHAQQWYRRDDPYADDKAASRVPTGTAENQKPALRRLNRLYGSTPAAKFGPLALKALRRTWVDDGLSVKTVNGYAAIIKGVFRWAVSEELLPVEVHTALETVRILPHGRGQAKETDPVEAVAAVTVDATLPHLPPVVADMVRFQRITGCRPSEVCTIRPCDVEQSTIVFDQTGQGIRDSNVWEYRPAHHKTKHKGQQRRVPLGVRAQEILRPYLLPLSFTPTAFCFSPAASEADRRAAVHAQRETPLEHGNKPGSNRQSRPKRKPAARYTKDSYARAVTRACEVAFNMPEHLREPALRAAKGKVTTEELARLRQEAAAWRALHCWSPNQLRHSKGTAVRQRYGLDAAQVVLGHSEADTTQIYAEADWAKAVQVAREVG